MFHNVFANKGHRYKAVLITLIAFIFISPHLPPGPIGDILVAGIFFLVICATSFHLSSQVIARWFLPLFGILSLIFGAFIHINVTAAILSRVMMFLFFCTAIWVFGQDVFNKKSPHSDLIYGAIIIYFLIGITYAIAYLFLQELSSKEFIIANTGLAVSNPFDLYYFSFITLATVGYGDIIAKGQFAKIICMLESITGLFYFAILVSSLIGIFHLPTEVRQVKSTKEDKRDNF
jgi:hypothetical protein